MVAPKKLAHFLHALTSYVLTVADLEGAEPAPAPFGRRTDAVTHGTPDMWQRYYYGDTIAIFISSST